MPAGWGNYDIWQFSSEGPFVGDSNFFPGTVHDLRALATNAGAKNRSWHPQPAPRVETAPKTRFRDVPQSSPFYKEIEWLANEKITTGWPDGTFRPDAGVERAAMAAYFYRMAGSPPVNLPARSPFRDVAPQDQFYREIVWMHQQGIATGWADGTFRPHDSVNRDAMAAFFYRFAGKPAVPAGRNFSDVGANNQFYREIMWLKDTGIATGWADGTFRPWQPVERGAMAAFIYRYKHK